LSSAGRTGDLADRAAQLARVLEVDRLDRPDRARRDVGNAHGPSQADGRDDRELGGRVGAVEILARIRFGVSGALRFGERIAERNPLGLHPAEDVIAGAAENAADFDETITGRPPEARAGRDTAGH
jgi:hypothetical protein